MNAKKIMGAVLVALLATALFVGAGAAAISASGDVFIYQAEEIDSNLIGTWTSDAGNQVIVTADAVTPVGTFVPGVYKNGDYTLSVTYPAATITGVVGTGANAYNFIGATLYTETLSTDIHVSNATSTDLTPLGYYLTYPNTTSIKVEQDNIDDVLAALTKGSYKLAVYYNISDFVAGTLADFVYTAPVTITVADADDATITASVDQMIKGETFTITITGKPGVAFLVNGTEYAFKFAPNQAVIDTTNGNVTFVMPNTGKVSYTLAGNTSVSGTEQTLKLWSNATGDVNGDMKYTGEKITVKFAKGTLTAKTEAASYFVGDVVKIIGTTTAGEPDGEYKINGTNFYALGTQNIVDLASYKVEGDSVKTFEFTINTAQIYSQAPAPVGKMMDVGTYTVTIKAGDVTAYVPLTLKQPFISILEAPEVIVQGEDDVEFIINAEAAEKIAYYIFGTNYFAYAEEEDNVEDEDGEDIENQFVVGLTEDDTKTMAPGQYFAVFQHPMYDGELNIQGNSNWDITLIPSTVLFNVKERQTANAAQALCDALDTQNIDDMYVKYSFFVVGEDESFTISEIPTSVAQGETITISGVSTANADNTVTVEMISTAFAAVPKETVGSAAFILVTTTVAEDGTWEVTLDTSDLNVDEYSLNVACEGTTWKNVKVNVVEAADEPVDPEQPGDEPEQPGDEPVAPETPGFGALAALAGLGAVAVLLLRRE